MKAHSIIPSCRREAQRQRRRHRAILAGIALLGSAGFCSGLSAWLDHRASTQRMSFADALWVADRDLTCLYAPGTPEQRSIVAQLLAHGGIAASDRRFPAPVLYRMGVDSASEGILIAPFDPRHPETARQMKAAPQPAATR